MGLRSLIALVSLVSVAWLGGCSKDAQKVQPETRGKRGETCLARNDCDTGLACLNGICAKNEFNIEVTAKQCTRVECGADEDCCGDRATSAPAKCKGRESKCNQPTLAGCVQTTCLDDMACGGGGSCLGTCGGQTVDIGMPCAVATECTPSPNTCSSVTPGVTGTCSATFALCSPEAPCAKSIATCSTKICRCQNPEYDPAADICTDEECENICLLRCQDSLCLEDKSCKTDAECLAVGLKVCDENGRCVECTVDKDCDEKNGETCESGLCHKPCTQNEECGLFEECDKKAGDCKYVGCQDDRDCILAASRGQVVGTGGTSGQNTAPSSSDDPRLYKCLASDAGSDIKTCKIPCENDGSCGQFQVCDAGYCKFVGCENDEQCRAYLGIANQMTSDAKPYVATAKCEAPPTDAASSP
jgi:hypothetical protein